MIAPSSTLFRYVSRQFLFNLAALMTILLGLVLLLDVIELLRRTSGMPHVNFGLVLSMSMMKLPYLGERMLPMGVLFSAVYTCWKLNKTSELVIIRAAGLSAWQFLSPLLACALVAGFVSTTVINPVSSTFMSKYEQLDRVHFRGDANLATVSKTGVWLRQPVDEGYALLHAATFDKDQWQLNNVTVLFFDDQDNFIRRLDGPIAFLRQGFWDIRAPLINFKSGGVQKIEFFTIPTALTAQKIEESFADPDSISFWRIPEYIHIMEMTGFPATRLHLHFHTLLAQPFLFAAMILLAATFSLRPPRMGGAAGMIVIGVGVGFCVFFLQSMLQAFGASQKIPVYLAAWSPAAISLLLGGTALLHKEDG